MEEKVFVGYGYGRFETNNNINENVVLYDWLSFGFGDGGGDVLEQPPVATDAVPPSPTSGDISQTPPAGATVNGLPVLTLGEEMWDGMGFEGIEAHDISEYLSGAALPEDIPDTLPVFANQVTWETELTREEEDAEMCPPMKGALIDPLTAKWYNGPKVKETGQSDMKIRTAAIDDLDAVTELEAQCFPATEAAGRESFRTRLEAFGDHFWLLFDGDILVSMVNGMVTDQSDLVDEMYHDAGMHDPEGKWQMIFGVDTLPEYRRRGCAERVMNRAIADAREQGRAGLVLTCKDALAHYYAKFGFADEGVSNSTHGGVVWRQMRLTF